MLPSCAILFKVQLACSLCRTYVEIGVGREMRPSLPFVCKSCRAKSKQGTADRASGEPRSSPSMVPSSASGRDRRAPSSEPEYATPSSGPPPEWEPVSSRDLLMMDGEVTLPGGAGELAFDPARDPEQRRASGPTARGRGLTLAERIAQQELEDIGLSPGSSQRAHQLDALDVAAEAALELAVVTPDGGLRQRDRAARPRTFAVAPRDDARRAAGAAPPAVVGRSPSALPPPDSDPVSIQDLAQMLSPGVEPPSLSFGPEAADDERASHPAPAPEPAAPPRKSAPVPAPVRPPARREHRTTSATPALRQRPAHRAGGTSRPITPPSEMPPAPLSEMPPAPSSLDEVRPSSHRSSPELRLKDVQAMAALAPQPESARRAWAGSEAVPGDSSRADLSLMAAVVPPSVPASPRAADEPRPERAKPKAAQAPATAGEPGAQGSGEGPAREPPARASSAPRTTARTAGDRISQADLGARAGRKEDSGLIDLRNMAQSAGVDDGSRRNGELRADDDILSISGGLFEGATAGRSSSPGVAEGLVEPSGEPDPLAVEGHTSSGEDAPARASVAVGARLSGGLRALSTPASRQNFAVVGWVLVVFLAFGASMYFAQIGGKPTSAAAVQTAPAAGSVAPAADSAAPAAAPTAEAAPPPPADPAMAGHATDREPSLDDEPVAAPPAAAGAAEQAPAASAAAGPPGEPAAPSRSEPAQAGSAPGATPEASAAPAASAAPVAKASPPASDRPEATPRTAQASAPSAPERPRPAGKQQAPAPLLPARDEPARFDQGAAAGALASAASAAAGCTGEGLTGTARVAVTFAPSGKVMSSRVEGGDLVGTATAGCIAGAFRNISVPPFEGIPVTVMKQVKIR
ncbi:hypothetical protein SOCE26_015170 [Sorangium cellulosum]|uniref:Zinc finger/thioredoxin putative domain-containing protein n=1 Tax=Sorangium cellulosum TaxID=56 RepID=A0A2L0ELF7_SORCE|nr:hypothetical protein [Sorangium cellulosum]AUX40120.1 hypothetical protein SOCE26_015170 [Sorangium cellulosum]